MHTQRMIGKDVSSIPTRSVHSYLHTHHHTYLPTYPHTNIQAADAFGSTTPDKTNYLMAAASYAGRVFIFIIVVFKMAYVGVKVTYLPTYICDVDMSYIR